MLQNCERVGRVGENVRPWESVACGKVKRNIRFVSIHIYNVFKFHAKKTAVVIQRFLLEFGIHYFVHG